MHLFRATGGDCVTILEVLMFNGWGKVYARFALMAGIVIFIGICAVMFKAEVQAVVDGWIKNAR